MQFIVNGDVIEVHLIKEIENIQTDFAGTPYFVIVCKDGIRQYYTIKDFKDFDLVAVDGEYDPEDIREFRTRLSDIRAHIITEWHHFLYTKKTFEF